MFDFEVSVKRLRIVSFFLFSFTIIALLGTLLFHNFLVNFIYIKNTFPNNYTQNSKINCNKKNDFCYKKLLILAKPELQNQESLKSKTLIKCNKYKSAINVVYKNNNIDINSMFGNLLNKKNYINLLEEKNIKEFLIEIKKKDRLNTKCIKNSNYYHLYKYFGVFFEKINSIKENKKYKSGTSHAVFPFFYGETSISNIAKRYPLNYIFKPFLYLSSILIFIFWYRYNKILQNLLDKNKNNLFFIFGVLSGFFLFFHVLFLGMEIEGKWFKNLRKLIILFFILFEILAQSFLVTKIYMNLKILNDKINRLILNLKLFLVSSILLSTLVIVGILSFRDLEKKVDYIIEWNYFFILLFFYLLSAYIWKKISSNNPSTT